VQAAVLGYSSEEWYPILLLLFATGVRSTKLGYELRLAVAVVGSPLG